MYEKQLTQEQKLALITLITQYGFSTDAVKTLTTEEIKTYVEELNITMHQEDSNAELLNDYVDVFRISTNGVVHQYTTHWAYVGCRNAFVLSGIKWTDYPEFLFEVENGKI